MPSPADAAAAVARSASVQSTRQGYRGILKASALVGSSSALVVLIGMVRNKVLAMLLGPSGFGLVAMYTSIVDLVCSVAGMGINASGVRQIAEAAASGDKARVQRTAFVLRRVSLLLAIGGALLLFASSGVISTVTFGTSQHAGAIALLSLAVAFRLLADGQNALIQGLRRIVDLAKSGVLSALLTTVAAIPIIYLLREDGVVVLLVAGGVLSAGVAWWYGRAIASHSGATLTALELRADALAMLKLGIAFMASGLLMLGAAYIVRLILAKKIGIEAAGLYQSSWTLGGLYVGFILQAMGADFYPRLVGAIRSPEISNRLVNEQTHVGLLLAWPGVLATLSFASLALHAFYSSEFDAAAPILRWICLGMALRVITWPIGYIIVAKGAQTVFIACELAWTVVNVGLTWFCVGALGAEGAGVAFLLSYIFHGFLVFPVAHRMTGFTWSRANIVLGLVYLSSAAAVFLAVPLMSTAWALAAGVLVTGGSAALTVRLLVRVAGPASLPPSLQRLVSRFDRQRPGQP